MQGRYEITMWKLGEDNTCESSFACRCDTEWELIELFDCLTRGIRGHYKAWAIDIKDGRTIRESEVSYSR